MILPIVAAAIGGSTYLTTIVGQRVMQDLFATGLRDQSMSLRFTATRTGELQSAFAERRRRRSERRHEHAPPVL
jgi:hypothetical protein